MGYELNDKIKELNSDIKNFQDVKNKYSDNPEKCKLYGMLIMETESEKEYCVSLIKEGKSWEDYNYDL